jgi:hypothetical protein
MEGRDMRKQNVTARRLVILPAALALLLLGPGRAAVHTQAGTPAIPQVFNPPSGDPRLEPIPGQPLFLRNTRAFTTDQFGHVHTLQMRFPPRVNGQVESNGDKHADLYVLFDANTHLRIQGAPIILEAIPKGAAGDGSTVSDPAAHSGSGRGTRGDQGNRSTVSDLVARKFSSIWELHAVMVDTTLGNPLAIDSELKVFTSPAVKQVFQTNIFLNCPIVPNGSTVDVGSAPPEDAVFEGQHVTIVPYDIEDGGFNVQVLYMFKDSLGNILGYNADGTKGARSPDAGAADPDFLPHLVASHSLGDPFYTSIWDVWQVTVPDGYDYTQIKSPKQVTKNGVVQFTISNGLYHNAPCTLGQPSPTTCRTAVVESGIRLNCPVVMVDGESVQADTWMDVLTMNGAFEQTKFPFEIPLRRFTKSRTFFITEINPGGTGLPPVPASGLAAQFPQVDPLDKGNVIPLILQTPLSLAAPGPNSSGGAGNPIIRFDQDDLTASWPSLPPAIEANVSFLIANGLLDPQWAQGRRPYQDRLAVVGRAIFELFKLPTAGADQKDVTTCYACHSTPSFGGSSRGLYTLESGVGLDPVTGLARPDIGSQTNAGSMWGSGAAELLYFQLLQAGLINNYNPTSAGPAPFPLNTNTPHGTLGRTGPSIRDVFNGANNAHFGVQNAEQNLNDNDGDGFVNEISRGEITSEAIAMLNLDVPREGDADLRTILGISSNSVENGRAAFRKAQCTTCHRVFTPFPGGTTLELHYAPTSPGVRGPTITGNGMTVQVSHHAATQADVNSGDAQYVGQPGARLYGDFTRHAMGPGTCTSETQTNCDMFANGNITPKTAELWDVGSDAPLLRHGNTGPDIRGAILKHHGEGQISRDLFTALAPSQQGDLVNFLRVQTIQGKLAEGSGAKFPPNVTVTGSGNVLDGGRKDYATVSLNTKGNPTYGSGSLSYNYAKAKLNFTSTRIADITVENQGDLTAITGEGAVNGATGYRFTAVYLSSSRLFGITIVNASTNAVYYTTAPASTHAINVGTFSF